ncbi:serpin family protein [Nocardiopsis lucentensis]|uniref:serpin family protein n=1 Tax=Nocardiopsis lucentensis TaxID=53441 RepID=UPI000345A6AE|nr:serpin family protein [Nocardiopsis lucentensis]
MTAPASPATHRDHAFLAALLDWAVTAPGRSHVWSPQSVGTVLALLASAAGGRARDQLCNVLLADSTFPAPPGADAAVAAHLDLLDTAVRVGDTENIVATTALYTAEGMRLRPEFEERMLGLVGSEVATADFARDPEGTRTAINAAIADATQGLVRALLPPGSVTPQTLAVLATTLWVRLRWVMPFDPEETRPRVFHAPEGDREVPMMWSDAYLEHARAAGWSMVSLEGDQDLTLDVLLPDDPSGELPALTPDTLAELRGNTVDRPVDLSLPRFRLEHSVDVLTALRELSFDALAEAAPDLPGMCDRPARFDRILHRSVVTVDEAGAEAAAATAMVAVAGVPDALPEPPPPVEFTADRPFVFVLRRGEAILFLGRVTDPADPGPAAS